MAITEEYDIEGYFRGEDIKKNERCYSLHYHEERSLEEIQRGLSRGELSKEQLENYLSYLDNLELKLITILITEEKEGLANLGLKSDLSQIRKLKSEILFFLKKEANLPISMAA